jgi:hypothetical protein
MLGIGEVWYFRGKEGVFHMMRYIIFQETQKVLDIKSISGNCTQFP